MLALYLFALGIGGTMILASLLLGGGDKELGHGADHSADHSASHDASHDAGHGLDKSMDKTAGADKALFGGWLLSTRFWTFALATFGLTGTLLSMLSVPALLTGILALAVGVGLGWGAARLFRALNHDEVTGATEFSRYVGEEARVVLPVKAGQPGKIVIQSMAGRVEMLATTRDEEPLGMGTAVIIASVENGVADVSRMPVLPSTNDASRQRAAAAAGAESTERSGG